MHRAKRDTKTEHVFCISRTSCVLVAKAHVSDCESMSVWAHFCSGSPRTWPNCKLHWAMFLMQTRKDMLQKSARDSVLRSWELKHCTRGTRLFLRASGRQILAKFTVWQIALQCFMYYFMETIHTCYVCCLHSSNFACHTHVLECSYRDSFVRVDNCWRDGCVALLEYHHTHVPDFIYKTYVVCCIMSFRAWYLRSRYRYVYMSFVSYLWRR